MKRGFLFVAAAIVIGVGSAFTVASPSGSATPVYNTTAGLGTPVWAPITSTAGQGDCFENPQRECKALEDNGVISVTDYGNYIE